MRKGKIFYSIYFTFIILFFAGMAWVLVWLHGWLKDYEASQPTAKCNEIVAELFTNPDWGKIYDLAGMEDTIFEGRDVYISYMSDKVGSAELTCSETSAGLSGNKKYFIKLGEEKLLSFTLVGSENSERGITEWSLGEISLILNRGQSVRILKKQGHTAYINGVKLDEEYTVQRISTQAENYLPDEVYGPRYELQVVDGLLLSPRVSITDESGTELEITFDNEKAVYTEQTEIPVIEDDEKTAAIEIAEGYCEYMIGATNSLSSFFDSDTNIYRTIRQNESWMQQSYADYRFEDENISDYFRYTDELFSARISLSLNVTRNNGTIKKYTLDSNFFFRKQKNGGYLAVEMTNLDIQQPISEVRLIYRNDSETLQDEFVRADSKKLTTPLVTVPEGESFSGWAKEITDEAGRTSRVLLFVPDENGEIALPDGYVLEPMILYPVFEDMNTEDKGE